MDVLRGAGGAVGARGVVVRRAVEDDWAGIREVRLAALADAPVAFCERYAEAVVRGEPEWRARARRTLFVAVDPADPDGRFVGMAGLSVEPDPDRVDIVSVWVDPAWRGRGAVDALVESVRAAAEERGARTLGLFVHEANERAQRAYRRFGFRLTGGWLPYPLSPGQRELEMTRPVRA